MAGETLSGLPAVLDQLRPQDAPAPGAAEPEQLDLLGLPVPKAGAVVPAVYTPAPAPGRGRPAGSRNKRTAEWADFLLTRYGSPLEVLAQIAKADVADLVASLGCDRLAALQEKRHAAVALAPYIHQRQAVAIDLTQRQAVELTILHQDLEPEPDSLAATILGVVDVEPEA